MVLLLRVIGLDKLSDGRRKLRVQVGVGQFLLVGRRCLRRRAREERLEKATDRLELLEGYLAPSLPLPPHAPRRSAASKRKCQSEAENKYPALDDQRDDPPCSHRCRPHSPTAPEL